MSNKKKQVQINDEQFKNLYLIKEEMEILVSLRKVIKANFVDVENKMSDLNSKLSLYNDENDVVLNFFHVIKEISDIIFDEIVANKCKNYINVSEIKDDELKILLKNKDLSKPDNKTEFGKLFGKFKNSKPSVMLDITKEDKNNLDEISIKSLVENLVSETFKNIIFEFDESSLKTVFDYENIRNKIENLTKEVTIESLKNKIIHFNSEIKSKLIKDLEKYKFSFCSILYKIYPEKIDIDVNQMDKNYFEETKKRAILEKKKIEEQLKKIEERVNNITNRNINAITIKPHPKIKEYESEIIELDELIKNLDSFINTIKDLKTENDKKNTHIIIADFINSTSDVIKSDISLFFNRYETDIDDLQKKTEEFEKEMKKVDYLNKRRQIFENVFTNERFNNEKKKDSDEELSKIFIILRINSLFAYSYFLKQ